MSENCSHRIKTGTTMYVGKRWTCIDCGQLMECVNPGEHKEVDGNE